jgi:hypothetical protein
MESTGEDANDGGGACMADDISVVRERPINIEFMNMWIHPV